MKDSKIKIEQCRQKIAKQYKDKINQLESENTKLKEKYNELRDTNLALEEENRQLTEWVERMLEYTNMDKETLNKLLNQSKEQKLINEIIGTFIGGLYGNVKE